MTPPADAAKASKWRRFNFKTRVKASYVVGDYQNKSLESYFMLPLDQYSVLDARFISRRPEGFRLSVPLSELRLGESRPLESVGGQR